MFTLARLGYIDYTTALQQVMGTACWNLKGLEWERKEEKLPWIIVLLVNHIQEAAYLPSSSCAYESHWPPIKKDFNVKIIY